MFTEKPLVVELRKKGQLTLPKKLREQYQLDEGSLVMIIPIGDGMIVTPKSLDLEEARRKIRQILKTAKVSIREVLEGLEEDREGLYKEKYGPTE